MTVIFEDGDLRDTKSHRSSYSCFGESFHPQNDMIRGNYQT